MKILSRAEVEKLKAEKSKCYGSEELNVTSEQRQNTRDHRRRKSVVESTLKEASDEPRDLRKGQRGQHNNPLPIAVVKGNNTSPDMNVEKNR